MLNMSKPLKKTLIGGFSCINTRLAFDIEMLMNDYNKEKVIFDFDIEAKKTNKMYLVQNFKNERELPVWYGYDKAITIQLY